jgi:hypothetical protein
MEWTKVKQAKDVTLEGVSVDFDRTDGSFKSVTFTDAKGNKFRIGTEASYSSLAVEIPAKPKLVEKHVLRGEVAGLKVEESFDSEYAARDRKQELSGRFSDAEDGLTVAKEQVPDEIPF